ncbi:MAG: hemin receptor [Bergeyella sp.]
MIKRTLMLLSVSATYFIQAQDVSVIKNTVDVYSNSALGGSSKYQGMAGSMGALGGDYSTLNSNPAGIGVSVASDFSGTLSIAGNENTSTYNGSSNSYKVNDANLGNIGGVVVFRTADSSPWKFVNMGVNYSYQSVENYVETNGNSNMIYDITDDTGASLDNLTFKGHAYDRYGNISKMSLGLGANYDHRIYVGAGINMHSSAISQYDTAAFTSQSGATDYYSKQYTPFSESADGFSASVGVIGKVNKNFRLGAALETPTWWKIAREYNFYEDSVYGDGTGIEDRKLSTPLKATLSAAFVADKDFSINVDYVLGLTKPKYKVYGDAESELNDFFNDNYKNLSEVRVGAEYRIADFRLRGGYSFVANPFDTMSLNVYDTAGNAADRSYDNLYLGKRNTLAFGIGYDFKSFYIDAAYQHITSEYSNPFIQGYADYNTGYFSQNYIVNSDAAIVSEVENKQSNFFITVGWKF